MRKIQFKYGLYVKKSGEPSKFGGRVFVKISEWSGGLTIQHGKKKKTLPTSYWKPVKGDGLLVGDLVRVLSSDSKTKAKISAMDWNYESQKITYTLKKRSGPLEKQFFIEDLVKLSIPRIDQSNPELEAALHTNPNDQEAWIVYGDWLQSKDDPRGEIIALEIALQKTPKNQELLKRRQYIKRNHQRVAVRELYKAAGLVPGEYREIKLEWFAGFIRKAQIQLTSKLYKAGSTINILPLLLDNEIARFLSELRIEHINKNSMKYLRLCVPLLSLRKLTLKSSSIVETDKVFLNMPNLEYLKIRDSLGLFANLNHENIKILEMDIIISHLKHLAQGYFPKLETLELRIHNEKAIRSTNLKELTESKALPGLKSLLIRNFRSEKKNIVFESIFPSALMDRLDKFVLEINNLREANADYFIKNRQSLEHLKELKILYRTADSPGIAKLRDCFGKRLTIKRLRIKDTDNRY